jgi:hypothetical protein
VSFGPWFRVAAARAALPRRSPLTRRNCWDDSHLLSAGEVGTILVLAQTPKQAVVIKYMVGFFKSSPILERMIAEDTRDELRLTNGVVIAVHPNNHRSVRDSERIAFCACLSTPSPDSMNACGARTVSALESLGVIAASAADCIGVRRCSVVARPFRGASETRARGRRS